MLCHLTKSKNIWDTPPHTRKSKEKKNSTLECKGNDQMLRILEVKNVNKSKDRLTPVKLESKKQDKKVLVSREGSRGKFPSTVRKKPRPTYIRSIVFRFAQIGKLCPYDINQSIHSLLNQMKRLCFPARQK